MTAYSGAFRGSRPHAPRQDVTVDERQLDDQASRLRKLARDHGPCQTTQPPASLAAPPRVEATVGSPAAPTPEFASRSCPIVTVTSGKGGVGKTNISVNLAIALVARGCRVTVLDGDLGLANADVICGLAPTTRLESTIGKGGSRTLSQIALDAPGGFRLIPGAVGIPRIADLHPELRRQLIDQLDDVGSSSDVILIDTGAGIGSAVMSFLSVADACVVVTTPEPTSIADAYAVLKASRPHRKPDSKASIVVNQVEHESEAKSTHQRISQVANRFLGFQPDLLGFVRRDMNVVRAVRERRPFVLGRPTTEASRDIQRLARDLSEMLQVDHSPVANVSGRSLWSRLWG